MIMDLPKEIKPGSMKHKDDAYIEDGILKIRNTASFRYVVYQLTYQLKGGKHKCKYCKRRIESNKATMDHLYPQDMGGPTITNNLVPACADCNSEKSNMTIHEYAKYLKKKEDNTHKEYLKKLQLKKLKIQSRKEYQIPKKWISEKEISKIHVEIMLDKSKKTTKYRKAEQFYIEHGYFKAPIVIDRKGFLLDGFYTVLFAIQHDIKKIPVIQLENVELVI